MNINKYQRPRNGYCYLDFLDHWLLNSIFQLDTERAVKYARESCRWALRMYPELSYEPHNIDKGYN